jgi:hypothetical protein
MTRKEGTPISCYGSIVVSPSGIAVSFTRKKAQESSEVEYDKATVENLFDAARILAAWMGIKYEDIAKECQRVHSYDQTMAFLKEHLSER